MFILLYPAHLTFTGILTLGQFITVITLALPMTGIVAGIAQGFAAMQASKAALQRIRAIWNAPMGKITMDQSDHLKRKVKESLHVLEMEKVSFGYNDEVNVLQDIDLALVKGQTYLLTGGNGSGKTTLTRLLKGLYIPSKGTLRIQIKEGKSLYEGLRRAIAVAEQDPVPFAGTLYENIALGNQEKSIQEVADWFESLSMAKVFPKDVRGDDVDVSLFSGGQKKCLSIARAMVHGGEVLLLDEPTANVDTNTKKAIIQDIVRYQKESGATLFMITHDGDIIKQFPNARRWVMEDIKEGQYAR